MRKLAEHGGLVNLIMLLMAMLLVGVPRLSFCYTLNIAVTGPGGISATAIGYNPKICGGNCSYNYATNTVVTLSRDMSAVGYSFTSWGGACTGNGSCQVSMTEDKSVTATFADITPPDTAIDNMYISPVYSSPVSFGLFFSSRDGSAFECMLNSGSWSVCTAPYSNTYVYPMCTICRTETPMTFSVKAKDEAGNYDPTPATHVWTIYHPLSDPLDNVQDGGDIQLKAADINGNLSFSRAITLTLSGGYGSDYMSQTGITTVHGVVTIDAGTVVMESIAIAP